MSINDQTIANQMAKMDRLARQAEKYPRLYRWRIILFALLGYAYISCLFLVLFFILITSIYFAFLFPTFGIITFAICMVYSILRVSYVFGKSIWIRIDLPEGIPLEKTEHPDLFRQVEKICDLLESPQIDHIYLTNEFNASMTRVARFGIFGPKKNYLVLGFPLFFALSPKELDSVIGHEVGHLSRQNALLDWIYRVRITWFLLSETIENKLGWFFRSNAPRFDRYSFALMRKLEYESDESAARVSSSQIAGGALLRFHLIDAFLNDSFWPGILAENMRSSQIPDDIYLRMSAQIGLQFDIQKASENIEHVMRMRTGFYDSHPSLCQRLDALGVKPDIPESITITAGENYLGDFFEVKLRSESKIWRAELQDFWKEEYQSAQKSRSRLTELQDFSAEGKTLTMDEKWELAGLIQIIEGDDALLLNMKEMLKGKRKEKVQGRISFHIGRVLLSRNDSEGLTHLETAFKNAPYPIRFDACELAISACFDRGELDLVQIWTDRLKKVDEVLQKSVQERLTITNKNTFRAPVLDEDVLNEIIQLSRSLPSNYRIYLVEKVVPSFPKNCFPEDPCYVLSAYRKFGPLRYDADEHTVMNAFLNTPIEVIHYFGIKSDTLNKIEKNSVRIM